MFKKFHFLLLLLLMNTLQVYALNIPKDLDYSQSFETNSFVFIPQFGTKQGVVYFKTFTEKMLDSSSSHEITTFQVHLTPSAVQNGEYTSFFDTGWKDLKSTSPSIKENGCTINDEILHYLKGYPTELQPKIIAGGYPTYCGAVFKVLDSEKDPLIQLILEKGGIKLDLNIPLCDTKSKSYETKQFWEELKNSLQKQGKIIQNARSFTMPLWNTIFEAYIIAQKRPILFQNTSNKEEVLSAFLDKIDINIDNKTITADELILTQPTTVCIPKLIRIQK